MYIKIFKRKYRCPFKIGTMVKFNYEDMPKEDHKHYLDKFPENEYFVFMGEIVQMPGHCILCNHNTGKMYSGYHTENFVSVSDDYI